MSDTEPSPESEGTFRITFQPEIADDIRAFAEEQGLSVSRLMLEALGIYRVLCDNHDSQLVLSRGDEDRLLVLVPPRPRIRTQNLPGQQVCQGEPVRPNWRNE